MKRLILNKIRGYRYHNKHRQEAMKALRSIEAEKGSLSVEIKKQCDSYAKKVLGSKKYSPWLYVYSAIRGKFIEGWIPDNYYGAIIVPSTTGKYEIPSDLRALNTRFFDQEYFPDLLYVANGKAINPSTLKVIVSDVELEELLVNKKVLFKSDSSLQGKGIYFITDNKEITLSSISTRYSNGVFQEKIEQHHFFLKYHKDSTATLRVTTVHTLERGYQVRGCYLRLGQDKDTYIKSSSGIKVPINIESGNLYNIGYLPDWTSIDRHPQSKELFKGSIPLFNEIKKVVIDQHQKYPYAGIIGWDVIIDNNNQIKIMEWNAGHTGIKFSESVQGPILKDFVNK